MRGQRSILRGIAVATVAGILLSTSPALAKRIALVVGNGDYPEANDMTALPKPRAARLVSIRSRQRHIGS